MLKSYFEYFSLTPFSAICTDFWHIHICYNCSKGDPFWLYNILRGVFVVKNAELSDTMTSYKSVVLMKSDGILIPKLSRPMVHDLSGNPANMSVLSHSSPTSKPMFRNLWAVLIILFTYSFILGQLSNEVLIKSFRRLTFLDSPESSNEFWRFAKLVSTSWHFSNARNLSVRPTKLSLTWLLHLSSDLPRYQDQYIPTSFNSKYDFSANFHVE